MKSGVFALIAALLLLSSFFAVSPVRAEGAGSSPALAEGKVTPENGTWGDNFTFEVTYRDNENISPLEGFPKLYIDNEAITMEAKDPSDNDVTDNKIYEYEWEPGKDNVGSHSFFFYVETPTENARYPTTGENELTVTKRATSLTLDVDDHKPASGENVTFRGHLRTSDDNVAGGGLVLYKILSKNGKLNYVSAGSTATDENGHFTLSIEAPIPGIFFYIIKFSGDNYYSESESSRQHVNTLNEGLVLGVFAIALLAIPGVLFFLLSRGLVRGHYLKPILLGFLIGFFLYLLVAGFLGPLLAGGIAGYLFAKRTGGGLKHFRVGCMTAFLVLLVVGALGVLSTYSLMESPEPFLRYSITQIELLYSPIFLLIFYSLFTGLAAAIGGMLRGGPKPQEVEQTEQSPADSESGTVQAEN